MNRELAVRVTPPPRRVPLGLRCALLANLPVLFGTAILAIGMLLTLVFLSAGEVLGGLRLWAGARAATGVLTAVEPTDFTSGAGESRDEKWVNEHHRIYRLTYTFTLPDGAAVEGESYVKGRRPVRRIQREAEQERGVAVEYAARSPGTSRIRGTRTSPYGPGVLLILIAPAIGLCVAAAGVSAARKKVWLLRHGEIALATIVACREAPQGGSGTGRWRRFTQLRNEMRRPVADHIEEGTAVSMRGFSDMGIGRHKTEEVSGAEFKRGFRSHVKLFRGALFGLFGFWALIFAFLLWAMLQAEMAAFERALFLGVYLVFVSGFVGFGWFALRFTRRAEGVATGRVKMEDLRLQAECRFEFRTADGRTIQAQDRVTFDSRRLGDEPREPVVYDSAHPERAVLLDGLPARVRIGTAGDLEATGIALRVLALLGAGALVLAAVVGGGIAAGWFGA